MILLEFRCFPLPSIAGAHAVNDPINASVGNTEEVVCEEGHTYGGGLTSRMLTCGSNLEWQGEVLEPCERKIISSFYSS